MEVPGKAKPAKLLDARWQRIFRGVDLKSKLRGQCPIALEFSASAFIYDTAGNELSGPGSLRCYLIADKAENIPFLGIAILDALWKAGKGRIEFSASWVHARALPR